MNIYLYIYLSEPYDPKLLQVKSFGSWWWFCSLLHALMTFFRIILKHKKGFSSVTVQLANYRLVWQMWMQSLEVVICSLYIYIYIYIYKSEPCDPKLLQVKFFGSLWWFCSQLHTHTHTHTHTHIKLGIIYKEVMSEGKTCSEFYIWVLEMLLKQTSRQRKPDGSFFTITSLLILHNSEVFSGTLWYDLI